QVTEDDRLRGTGLLARRDDVPIADAPVLQLRLDLPLVDALDAVRALLHDAAPAHGDVGVRQHPQARRAELFRPVVEVEPAHLVGTVVRAVLRPDAAVVDHVVQAFRAVHGRADRTDQLARRVLAVHARDRLEGVLRVRGVA